MSSGWTLVGDLVRLIDETDTVRIGPGTVSLGPPPKLEVVGNALVTLQDKGGNVYDVKAYGAKGDGIADDLPKIQDAVAALRAGGGGTLYFPPGRYMVSSEIVIDGYLSSPPTALPFLVRGAGPQGTILVTTSPTANTIRTTYGGAATTRDVYMEIRDIMLGSAVAKTAGDAIRQECNPPFQNTLLVRNCWFTEGYNHVHVTAIGSATIKDCVFLNPINAAVVLEQFAGAQYDVGTVSINDNYFFRKPTTVNAVGVYGIWATTGASGLRVSNNYFISFFHPLLVDMVALGQHTQIWIDGNAFDGSTFDGTTNFPKLQITGLGTFQRFAISNNRFTGQASAGIQIDVTTAGGVGGIVQRGSITDNVFDLQGGSVPKGIVLAPTGTAAVVRELLVSGNNFSNLNTGIEIGALASEIFLSENSFEVETVTTLVTNNGTASRGAFFPDRVGVGRINDVKNGLSPTVKELYAYSNQAARPRVYLEGDSTSSSPGIDFAFDHSNTRRAAIVATAPVGQNNLGVQLELFTKPDSGAGITQRAILDAAGNLVWTSANYQEMMELGADPVAPAANKARLFLRDNGSGKTQLCVRFATGAVVVLGTQP